MTATTQDIKAPQLGSAGYIFPGLLSIPIEANCQIFANTPVFQDAAGFAVDGSNTVNPPVVCVGRAQTGVNNLSTNTPYGAQGAQQVTCEQGVFYYDQDGTITGTVNDFQPVFALDNQTCTVNAVQSLTATTWLPFLGVVQPPGQGQSGIVFTTNSQVPVFLGFPNPYGLVLRARVTVTLAQIQAKTSGTAFNFGPPMPPNARLLDLQVNLTTQLTGGGMTDAAFTLQGGTDTAGSLFGGAAALNMTTAAVGAYTSIGTNGGNNPYPSRGGQQLFGTLTATGGTLAGLTAGGFNVDLFYTLLP